MLFDRPYNRGRTHYGSFDLVTWSYYTYGESGEQSFRLTQWSQQCSTMPWKCLVITPFWAVRLQLCLCLVTLGSIACKYLQVFSYSAQDVEFVRIDL